MILLLAVVQADILNWDRAEYSEEEGHWAVGEGNSCTQMAFSESVTAEPVLETPLPVSQPLTHLNFKNLQVLHMSCRGDPQRIWGPVFLLWRFCLCNYIVWGNGIVKKSWFLCVIITELVTEMSQMHTNEITIRIQTVCEISILNPSLLSSQTSSCLRGSLPACPPTALAERLREDWPGCREEGTSTSH